MGSEMGIPEDVYYRGVQIEDRLVHDLGDPYYWDLMGFDGLPVNADGSPYFPMPTDPDEVDIQLEEIESWKEHNKANIEAVWWMLDFLVEGWFQDSNIIEHIESRSTANLSLIHI